MPRAISIRPPASSTRSLQRLRHARADRRSAGNRAVVDEVDAEGRRCPPRARSGWSWRSAWRTALATASRMSWWASRRIRAGIVSSTGSAANAQSTSHWRASRSASPLEILDKVVERQLAGRRASAVMNERSSPCSCSISSFSSLSSGSIGRPDAADRFIASSRKAAPARNWTTLSCRSRASDSRERASALSSDGSQQRVPLDVRRNVRGDLFAKVEMVGRRLGTCSSRNRPSPSSSAATAWPAPREAERGRRLGADRRDGRARADCAGDRGSARACARGRRGTARWRAVGSWRPHLMRPRSPSRTGECARIRSSLARARQDRARRRAGLGHRRLSPVSSGDLSSDGSREEFVGPAGKRARHWFAPNQIRTSETMISCRCGP